MTTFKTQPGRSLLQHLIAHGHMRYLIIASWVT